MSILLGIQFSVKISRALRRNTVERPRRFGAFSRLFIPILLLLLHVGCAILAILFIMHGSLAITRNVDLAQSAGEDLFLLSAAKLVSIPVASNLLSQNLNASLDVANGLTLNAVPIARSVNESTALLLTSLTSSSTQLSQIRTATSSLSNSSDAEVSALPALLTAVGNWLTVVGGINGPTNFPGSTANYELITKITLSDAASSITQTGSTLAVAGLLDFAATAEGAIEVARQTIEGFDGNNVADRVSTEFQTSFQGIRRILLSPMESMLTFRFYAAAQAEFIPSIQDTLSTLPASYQSSVSPILSSLDSAAAEFTKYFNLLVKIDLGRHIATVFFGVLGAIALFFALGGVMAKQPRWLGKTVLASFALGIIALIAGAGYLALSAGLGAACSGITPAGIEKVVRLAGAQLPDGLIEAVFEAREKCLAGVGGLDVIPDLLSTLDSSGNSASFLGQLDGVKELLANLTSGNVSIDTTLPTINLGIDPTSLGLDTAISTLDAVLDGLDQMLQLAGSDQYSATLRTAVGEIRRLGLSAVGMVSSSVVARTAEAEGLVKNAAGGAAGQWNTLDSGAGEALRIARAGVEEKGGIVRAEVAGFRDGLTAFATSAEGVANSTVDVVQGEVQVVVEEVKGVVAEFAKKAEGVLQAVMECQMLAQDTVVLQNAVCVGAQGGLDEVWFGMVVLGFCWTLGVFSMLWTAKRLWNTDPGWRWTGRDRPIPASEAAKYHLNGEQKITMVELDVESGDWPAFSGEAPKYQAKGTREGIRRIVSPDEEGETTPISGDTLVSVSVANAGMFGQTAFALPEMQPATPLSPHSLASAVGASGQGGLMIPN